MGLLQVLQKSNQKALLSEVREVNSACTELLPPPRVPSPSLEGECLRGLLVTPWTAGCQASLSFTIFPELPQTTSIESVMPSNQLVLCRSLSPCTHILS